MIKLPLALAFTILGSLVLPLSHADGRQALELASPFVDDAILQRGMPVPVWGWAEPGTGVTLSFAGQLKSGMADDRGKWRLQLDPLEASLAGREMTVESGSGERLTRRGLLVGEVWFSSGQSNMDWLASKSMCRDLANEIQKAGGAIPIREYTVDIGSSLFPQSRASSEAGWKRSSVAGEFSALSLAFAWELFRELQVPIGILRCSHGATPIETWTPYEGFADHPGLQDIAKLIRQSDPSTTDGKNAYAKFYDALKNWQIESERLIERGGSALPRPALPGIADDWKGASRMHNKKVAPLTPYAIRGAIWCQGESNASDGRVYAAKMEALINGWRKSWGRPDLPFYFTQLQCYGEPDPDTVGFADLREAQTLFFMNNKNVGMVAQHDLNSARPTGIHYYNKLDPGKRLARWALAHEYGRNLEFTGPIYQSHRIEGSRVRVQFAHQGGEGGGLMVGSKGMQAQMDQDPGAYVEPARETKGEPLKHFRLAGADKIWHAADAVIDGDEVVVTSKAVPAPRGVQYAYNASPIGANLYNRAGLPALPFAYYDGKQMFNEDDPAIVAAAEAETERKWGKQSFLLPSSLFRDGVVLQRDLMVPVWGHGVPGSEVSVSFGGQEQQAKVDEFERWRVTLDPMPASSESRDLRITCSNGESRTIEDVLVGDVWILTGSRSLSGDLLRPEEGGPAPSALPLVREFRIKTNARRFRTPRKLRMEIGGGKYVASWQAADFDAEGDPPSVAAYCFASQVQEAGIPVGIVTLGAENPPITWVSYASMQNAAGFEHERDELNLAYPNTDACKDAVTRYIEEMQRYNLELARLLESGEEIPSELAESAPAFPEPFYDQWASRTETATHTYNFCISPLTPFAVSGVVWIPDNDNISEDPSKYAPSLEVYAASLAETYDQARVPFLYAGPSAELMAGVGGVRIEGGMGIEFDEWPRSFHDIATKLGALAAKGRGGSPPTTPSPPQDR